MIVVYTEAESFCVLVYRFIQCMEISGFTTNSPKLVVTVQIGQYVVVQKHILGPASHTYLMREELGQAVYCFILSVLKLNTSKPHLMREELGRQAVYCFILSVLFQCKAEHQQATPDGRGARTSCLLFHTFCIVSM